MSGRLYRWIEPPPPPMLATLPMLTAAELDELALALGERMAMLMKPHTEIAEMRERYRTCQSLMTAIAEARYTLP